MSVNYDVRKKVFGVVLSLTTVISFMFALFWGPHTSFAKFIALSVVPYLILTAVAISIKSIKRIVIMVLISGYVLVPLLYIIGATIRYMQGNGRLFEETAYCESGMIDPETRTKVYDSFLSGPFTTEVSNWTVRSLVKVFGRSRFSYTGELPQMEDSLWTDNNWTRIKLADPQKLDFEYKQRRIWIREYYFTSFPCYYQPCYETGIAEYKPFTDDLLLVRRVCSNRVPNGNATFVYWISRDKIIQTLRNKEFNIRDTVAYLPPKKKEVIWFDNTKDFKVLSSSRSFKGGGYSTTLDTLNCTGWNMKNKEIEMVIRDCSSLNDLDWHKLFGVYHCVISGVVSQNNKEYIFELNAGGWLQVFCADTQIILGNFKLENEKYFIPNKHWLNKRKHLMK